MKIASIVKSQKLKRAPVCTPDMTVFQAAVEIAALKVNALAVMEDECLIGIISEQDIILCLADSGCDFYHQLVADWMTEDPVTCGAGTHCQTALNLMAKNDIRNLVVMSSGRLITIVSSKEVLAFMHENGITQRGVFTSIGRSTPHSLHVPQPDAHYV